MKRRWQHVLCVAFLSLGGLSASDVHAQSIGDLAAPQLLYPPPGEITTCAPIFRWRGVASAEEYLVRVDGRELLFPAQGACREGECAVAPDIALAEGIHLFSVAVRVAGDEAWGPPSEKRAIRVSAPNILPGRARFISPRPGYAGKAAAVHFIGVTGVREYRLDVLRGDGSLHTTQTIPMSDCALLEGTCSGPPVVAAANDSLADDLSFVLYGRTCGGDFVEVGRTEGVHLALSASDGRDTYSVLSYNVQFMEWPTDNTSDDYLDYDEDRARQISRFVIEHDFDIVGFQEAMDDVIQDEMEDALSTPGLGYRTRLAYLGERGNVLEDSGLALYSKFRAVNLLDTPGWATSTDEDWAKFEEPIGGEECSPESWANCFFRFYEFPSETLCGWDDAAEKGVAGIRLFNDRTQKELDLFNTHAQDGDACESPESTRNRDRNLRTIHDFIQRMSGGDDARSTRDVVLLGDFNVRGGAGELLSDSTTLAVGPDELDASPPVRRVRPLAENSRTDPLWYAHFIWPAIGAGTPFLRDLGLFDEWLSHPEEDPAHPVDHMVTRFAHSYPEHGWGANARACVQHLVRANYASNFSPSTPGEPSPDAFVDPLAGEVMYNGPLSDHAPLMAVIGPDAPRCNPLKAATMPYRADGEGGRDPHRQYTSLDRPFPHALPVLGLVRDEIRHGNAYAWYFVDEPSAAIDVVAWDSRSPEEAGTPRPTLLIDAFDPANISVPLTPWDAEQTGHLRTPCTPERKANVEGEGCFGPETRVTFASRKGIYIRVRAGQPAGRTHVPDPAFRGPFEIVISRRDCSVPELACPALSGETTVANFPARQTWEGGEQSLFFALKLRKPSNESVRQTITVDNMHLACGLLASGGACANRYRWQIDALGAAVTDDSASSDRPVHSITVPNDGLPGRFLLQVSRSSAADDLTLPSRVALAWDTDLKTVTVNAVKAYEEADNLANEDEVGIRITVDGKFFNLDRRCGIDYTEFLGEDFAGESRWDYLANVWPGSGVPGPGGPDTGRTTKCVDDIAGTEDPEECIATLWKRGFTANFVSSLEYELFEEQNAVNDNCNYTDFTAHPAVARLPESWNARWRAAAGAPERRVEVEEKYQADDWKYGVKLSVHRDGAAK